MKTIKVLLLFFISSFSLAGFPQSGKTTKPGVVNVPYTLAKLYNIKPNTIASEYVIAESAEQFEKLTYATAYMGENGQPTKIDFSKQFVVIIYQPQAKKGIVSVNKIVKSGKNITLQYSVTFGKTSPSPVNDNAILVIDKTYYGSISLKKSIVNAVQAFKVTPLSDVEANLGQVTFSKNGKILFYYNQNEKAGKIRINDKEYPLTQYQFINNQDKGKKDAYRLSGKNITIEAPDMTVNSNNEGGDCIYGKIAVVKITADGNLITLTSVNVQDCPAY